MFIGGWNEVIRTNSENCALEVLRYRVGIATTKEPVETQLFVIVLCGPKR